MVGGCKVVLNDSSNQAIQPRIPTDFGAGDKKHGLGQPPEPPSRPAGPHDEAAYP